MPALKKMMPAGKTHKSQDDFTALLKAILERRNILMKLNLWIGSQEIRNPFWRLALPYGGSARC
jgi:hypothetical protein